MRATNFITLAGGMLQSVLFGYGGIRLRPFQMDLDPYLPDDLEMWSLSGLNYRSFELSFTFDEQLVAIEVTEGGGEVELFLYLWDEDCTRLELEVGLLVTVPYSKMSLVTGYDESDAEICV